MFHQSRHSIRVPRSRSQLALSDYSALDDFSNDTLGRKPHPKWWKNDLSYFKSLKDIRVVKTGFQQVVWTWHNSGRLTRNRNSAYGMFVPVEC
jgi:hypothetical protein